MQHMDHTQASRQIGRAAALALVFLGVAYAIITMIGLVSLKSPQEPIQDPFFFLMEVLIVVMAPLMVLSKSSLNADRGTSVRFHSTPIRCRIVSGTSSLYW